MIEAAERGPHKSGGSARRSAARLAAVQALYQIDHSATSADAVLEEFLRFRLGDSFDTENEVAPHKNLFTEIVRGVAAHGTEIDEASARRCRKVDLRPPGINPARNIACRGVRA